MPKLPNPKYLSVITKQFWNSLPINCAECDGRIWSGKTSWILFHTKKKRKLEQFCSRDCIDKFLTDRGVSVE
jgi:hypothetical protein